METAVFRQWLLYTYNGKVNFAESIIEDLSEASNNSANE